MRKKLLLVLMIGIMVFTVACGDKQDEVELEKPIEDFEELGEEDSEIIVDWFENYEGTDLDGNEITSEIFAENELTLINGWATWCGPCVQEIPALGELAREYEGEGVGIKGLLIEIEGIVPNVGVSKKEKQVAKDVLKRLEADYQQILVSEDLIETDFKHIGAFPTTYFVDKDGRFVGGPIEGARSKDMWKEIIDERLEMVRENE